MRRLLRFYPREWRDRYEEEFTALLDECPTKPFNILDVLLGALDAHLRPQVGNRRLLLMDNKTRNSILAVFCAYMAFVLAGMLFYTMVDDSPFVPAMVAHRELALPWFVVEGGSVLALMAVCLGGAPIALAVLRQMLSSRRRDLILLLSVPLLVLGIWALYGVLTAAIIGGRIPFPLETRQLAPGDFMPPGNRLLGMVGVGLIAFGILASIAAVCVAVVRTQVDYQQIRLRGLDLTVHPFIFARLPSVAATLAMGLMLAGTLMWGLVARLELPQTFSENFGNWLAIATVMAVSTAVATFSVVRWPQSAEGPTAD